MRAAHADSLRQRLSLQIMLLALVGLGLVCATVFAATATLMERNQQRLLSVKVNKLTETSQAFLRNDKAGFDNNGLEGFLQLLTRNAERRPDTRLELYLPDNRPFYADPPNDPHVLTDHVQTRQFELPGLDGATAFKGRFTIDVSQDNALLRQILWSLIAATLAGALLSVICVRWVVRRGLSPLKSLTRQTEQIALGELSQRLTLCQPVRELEPWVNQFNQLMDKVEQTYKQLEAFNADVAHELRTPLAALIGKTEVTLSRERSHHELSSTLQGNLAELQRLSAMVNDMLFLSKVDHGALASRALPVSLRASVTEVAEFYDAMLAERQLHVVVQGDALSPIDDPLFKRAISNLIGNATRYASAGTSIVVQIDDRQSEVWVEVTNQGPRIAPEELPKLFDRFYRVDEARAHRESHHGLGLAIVAAIARMHGGRTRADSQGNQTTIGFSMQAAKAASRA